MTTIRDVAKKANVSVGTVSNVINGNSVVRDETRNRVLSAIEDLSFYPTAAARSLSTQRTNTIGLVRTELRPGSTQIEPDPFVLDLIEGISAAAVESGIGLTFWTIPVGNKEIELYRKLVKGKQVDGLILFAIRKSDPRIQYLKSMEFPFVVFGHDGEEAQYNWIDVDGIYGVEIVIEHLVALGHRRIGYLAPPKEQHLSEQRWTGFEQGMKAHQLTIDRSLSFEGDFTEYSGQVGAQYLLAQEYPPTAIVCANDRMAFGAIRAIQAQGLSVGEDISVVGFDDITLAQYSQPPLTTIHQPVREIASELFNLLQLVIAEEVIDSLSGQLIKPTLSVRESTGRTW